MNSAHSEKARDECAGLLLNYSIHLKAVGKIQVGD